MGQVHRRRGVLDIVGRRRGPAAELRLGAPGVDCPDIGGGGAEAPPSGYIISLVRLHERGFGIPAGRFVRAFFHHYKVGLHNFSPNAISQAAVFIAVCEGYLGVEAHWDLWKHLFRGELYTEHV